MRELLLALTLFPTGQPLGAQQGPSYGTRRAWTTTAVHVRETAADTGRPSVTIPAVSLVDVGRCDATWCVVEYGGRVGYGAKRYLSFGRSPSRTESAAPEVAPQGRGYTNSRGEWVPSPMRTPDGRAPVGASARCRDGTFSFSRSRRGTCSHHSGVAEWL
jgi:hypothetical protein